MGALQERITSTRKGSITSVQAVYVDVYKRQAAAGALPCRMLVGCGALGLAGMAVFARCGAGLSMPMTLNTRRRQMRWA